MPSLSSYVRESIKRAGPVLGTVVPIDGLTTTTVTSNRLKMGQPATQYEGMFMTRRDAASAPADRVRICTGFVGSTGVLTHSGANYADTTATSEYLELTTVDPYMLDEYCNIVLAKIRRREEVTIPTSHNERYWIGDQDWIVGPTDVTKITLVQSPVLTRNRYMEKWNGVYGATLPDWFTLSGSGATAARSTTGNRRGQYTCALVRSGTNATLSQDVTILWGGTTDLSLQSQDVTAVLVCTTSTASQIRVQINDGVTTSSSSYHTGGGTAEELTVTKTLSSSATQCVVRASIEVDGTAYIDELYGAFTSSLTDTIRNDAYGKGQVVEGQVTQGGAPLSIYLGKPGFGQQYVVYSRRPYPQFTGTRITGGTADADTTDAPLVIVAMGICAEAFDALSKTNRPDSKAIGAMAQLYQAQFAQMCKAHLQADTAPNGGMPLKAGGIIAPRRFGW